MPFQSDKVSCVVFHELVNQELDRLAALETNRDAQGAAPIDPAIIRAARDLIDRLPADSVRPPKVVPMAKGNLQFEWHDGERSLEPEIEDPQTIHYLKWDPQEHVEEEDTFSIRDAARVQMLIRWFRNSP